MSPPYRLVVFGLDGVLADAEGAVGGAVHATLAQLGIGMPEPNLLRSFIGLAPGEIYGGHYALRDAELRVALAVHDSLFRAEGIPSYSLYPGAADLVAELRGQGTALALVTAHVQADAERIVAALGLGGVVETHGTGGAGSQKDAMLRRVIGRFRWLVHAEMALVGDRTTDIAAARACGIGAIAAGYGYGTPGELQAARADRIVGNVAELRSLLLGETAMGESGGSAPAGNSTAERG